jgi:ribonuclease VapC
MRSWDTGLLVIVDSSALVAILLKERGHEPTLEHLTNDHGIRVGAPTSVERSMVLGARVGIVGKLCWLVSSS